MSEQKIRNIDVIQEQRRISKCTSLLFSRIVLLFLLFILFFTLQPVSVYIFAFTLLFPWVLCNMLTSRSNIPASIILTSCAEHFFYTPYRFKAEKNTGNLIIFFLVVWQLALNRTISYPIYLQLAPAIYLLVYILCRFICNIVFRHKIKSYYFSLSSLD